MNNIWFWRKTSLGKKSIRLLIDMIEQYAYLFSYNQDL